MTSTIADEIHAIAKFIEKPDAATAVDRLPVELAAT